MNPQVGKSGDAPKLPFRTSSPALRSLPAPAQAQHSKLALSESSRYNDHERGGWSNDRTLPPWVSRWTKRPRHAYLAIKRMGDNKRNCHVPAQTALNFNHNIQGRARLQGDLCASSLPRRPNCSQSSARELMHGHEPDNRKGAAPFFHTKTEASERQRSRGLRKQERP